MNADLRVDPVDWELRVLPVAGPQLIVGGPGTGKTEFLVRRATELIERGHAERLLVLSFSRRGANDLDTRIRAATTGQTRAVDVSTYHSFAARLVEAHASDRGWSRPPDVLPGPDQKQIVAELLTTEDPRHWSPAYRSLLDTRTFADEVTDFILRCREQLIGPSELADRERERADWRGLAEFLDRYDRTLRSRSVIDYGTLLAEATSLLLDPTIAESIADRYLHVLVDEYQDATHAQAVLLQRLVSPHGHLTAAADPYQSIYSFRGADIENVARFPDDFAFDGEPADRLVLTTSFRVPQAILDAAVRITAHELPGAAGKVTPAPGSGSVDVAQFTQQVEEAEWVASEIHRLNLEQHVPFGRMAVFTRSKTRFLGPLSRSLERRRIPHDPPDSRLIDQPAVRFIFDLATASTGGDGGDDVARSIRRILLGPMFVTPPARFAELVAERSGGGRSWVDLVRTEIDEGSALADLLAEASWATGMPAAAGLWHVWSTLPQIVDLATNPRRDQDRAAWSSFAQVLARWNERNPHGTLINYQNHSDSEDFEARPLLSYRTDDGDRVTVTTLHQAKGLDFDIVFISDAVEGVFPDLRTRDSLLGTRHLQPHLPADTAGYLSFRLQEERRLAYTAMTRATRRVVWTATDTGFDVDGGVPSRFLPLVAGVETAAAVLHPGAQQRPITVGQAEAALRRIAANPAARPHERIAAVATLAAGETLGLRPPEELVGMIERGPASGVAQQPLRLSPSQAAAYETCPRAYVLERRLGVGTGPSAHMEFGTLVHGVLERVEKAAAERGDRHGTIEDALLELDAALVPGMFGGGAYEAAWRERARTELDNLYTLWPSGGEQIGSEVELNADRPNACWIGRADRIEQRGTSIAVVDYKTGQTATIADAAASIQLGFYLIAARESVDIVARGDVTAAEMWFPLHPLKHSIAVRSFDIANLAEIEDRMAAVADGIAAEDWIPTPGPACDRCAVRVLCPAMPEGKEAFRS